jgi:hypothetical protein
MSPQRQKIEFEPNIPVSMTLEFDGGKPVAARNGTQYLYWVDGQRSMFMDEEPHQMIQATGAKAGDTLEICKTLQGRKVGWEVVHVVDEPAPPADEHSRTTSQPMSRKASTPTRPDPQPARPAAASQPAPQVITATTAALTSAFCVAIDALTEAREYARRKGLEMPITADAIRAVAISVFIDKCKGGSR